MSTDKENTKYFTIVNSGYVKGYDCGEAIVNYGLFTNREDAIRECRNHFQKEIDNFKDHLVLFSIRPIPGGGMNIEYKSHDGKTCITRWFVNEIVK